MSNKDNFIRLILKKYKRFSIKSLMEDEGLSANEAKEVCDLILSRSLASEHFYYICDHCGAPGNGWEITNENLSSVLKEEQQCEDCESTYLPTDENIIRYFTPNKKQVKKKPPKSTASESRLIERFLPEGMQKKLDSTVTSFIDDSDTPLIWHISDLHFGKFNIVNPKTWNNPAHDNNLFESFMRLIELRSGKNDLVLITGDCTINGDKKSSDQYGLFKNRLNELGFRVLAVPGNHDGWNNFPRTLLFLKKPFLHLINLAYKALSKRRRFYIDRYFDHDFSKKQYYFENISWGGKKIKFMLVDTTFRNCVALAQGIFPNNSDLIQACDEIADDENSDFTIMLLHHHIIRYREPINSNFQFIKHDLGMRLINSSTAKSFIKKQDIRLVLHGHKHLREKEVMLTNNYQSLFCPAPATFLSGNPKDGESVGFNLLKYHKGSIYWAEVENQPGEGYRCTDISKLNI